MKAGPKEKLPRNVPPPWWNIPGSILRNHLSSNRIKGYISFTFFSK